MPQKRNPDSAELARAKTGRVYGNLMGLLTVLKGLPLTYNLDLQEDKESTFDTVDTLLATLEECSGMISGMEVHGQRMYEAAEGDYLLATDLADYLVLKKGVPFRESHGIVARLCEYALSREKRFRELTMDEYQKFSPKFAEDVYSITAEGSVAARDVEGGTAPGRVEAALKQARKILEATEATE